MSALVITGVVLSEPEATPFTVAQESLVPVHPILIPSGCVDDGRTDRTNKRARVGFSIEKVERSL
jgi:hypothetical protein